MTREEAINIVRNIYQTDAEKEALQALIPELAESEDERMMREFNDWLCEEIECRTNDLRDEKDRRTLNMLCYILTKVKAYLEKQKEQKPAEWNANDKAFIKDCAHILDENGYAASAERLLSMFPIKPAEWSEEDRLHYTNVLEALEYVKGCKSDYDKIEAVKSDIAWLKLLRNRVGKDSLQPHWKPSEKQMKEWAVEGEWIWATNPPEKPGKYKVQLRYDTYSATWNGVKWIDDASGFQLLGVFKWKPIKEG